jgi:hypothetical protein
MMFGSVRTRSRKFVQVLVLAGLSTTLCSGAYGAPGAAKAGKDPVVELFQSANKLYGEKKYDAALLLFREAYGKSQSPNAHLMIGKCLLAQGDLPAAYEEFSATMREAAKRAETEPKYVDTRDAASSEIASLETKIAKVVITVVDATPSTRVLVNNVEVNKDKLGTPIAVMPGTLEIVAENLVKGKATQTEEVKAGETKPILLKVAEATPPPNSTPPTTTPEETTGGGVRKAGFAVLGVGAVGMGLFAIGGVQANSKFATLEKECGGTRCTDPKYADLIESGKTMDLLANVGLGLGIAGIVAGTVMVIVGGPKPKPKTTETSVFIGPGQTMFTLKHSF